MYSVQLANTLLTWKPDVSYSAKVKVCLNDHGHVQANTLEPEIDVGNLISGTWTFNPGEKGSVHHRQFYKLLFTKASESYFITLCSRTDRKIANNLFSCSWIIAWLIVPVFFFSIAHILTFNWQNNLFHKRIIDIPTFPVKVFFISSRHSESTCAIILFLWEQWKHGIQKYPTLKVLMMRTYLHEYRHYHQAVWTLCSLCIISVELMVVVDQLYLE